MPGPLHGIKVIDLTRVLAGPFCTMTLADLGAEIIKIEKPGTGDDSRAFGPHLHGESAYFMSINRGKKSLTLDLKAEKGREIFFERLLGEVMSGLSANGFPPQLSLDDQGRFAIGYYQQRQAFFIKNDTNQSLNSEQGA